MKALLFVSTVAALLASMSAFADSTVSIKTLAGDSVDVSAADLKAAYEKHLTAGRPETNAAHAYVNDDGSVTMIDPTFTANGESLPVSGLSYPASLCGFLGFVTKVMAEKETVTSGNLVLIDSDIHLQAVYAVTASSLPESAQRYKSITCRN